MKRDWGPGTHVAVCALLPLQAVAQPLAKGWADTDGGRGGAIVRVTNLNPDGPGSFKAAIERKGPRIVVFEVGGVIDLGMTSLAIREPDVTIAGHTAPSPGITLIRGGIDITTHDVIVQHIRVRTGASGQAKRSGWEADSITTVGARNVIVDHCSLTWGLDENLSASGPRFTGNSVGDWRNGTSHNITFTYNILAESLADSSHPKGEHSKGSLIHDNVTGMLIYRNLYAHNYERNPLLKGGAQAAVVNNLIFNPGAQAIYYNLMDLEWGGQRRLGGRIERGRQCAARGLFNPRRYCIPSDRWRGGFNITAATTLPSDDWVSRCRCSAVIPPTGAKIIEAAHPPVWPNGLAVLPAERSRDPCLALRRGAAVGSRRTRHSRHLRCRGRPRAKSSTMRSK